MPVEQLYYTWSERGLEGLGRFQVVACTPRLRTSSKIKSVALSLCRYDSSVARESDTPPVSYGWLTRGDIRLAFRRASTGADALGRPGNFAAHVLIGSRLDLTPPRLTAAFDTGLWWTGRVTDIPDRGALKPIDQIESVSRVDDTDEQARSDILALVLARRSQKVALPFNAETLMGGLRFAATLLPGILDDLSVSTFEDSRSAHWFDVLGRPIDSRPVPQGFKLLRPSAVREPFSLAAQFCSHRDAHAMATTRTAWRASQTARNRLEEFTSIVAVHQLARSGVTPEPRQIASLIEHPQVASDLLRQKATLILTAQEFAAGRAPLAKAVADVFNQLDGDVQHALGDAVGLAAAELGPPLLELLVDRSAAISTTLISGIAAQQLALAGSAETTLDLWPVQLIERVFADNLVLTPSEHSRLVDRGAVFVRELASSAVPEHVYGEIFAVAARRGVLSDRSAGQLLSSFPGRLTEVDRAMGSRSLAALLAATDVRTVVVMLAGASAAFDGHPFQKIIEVGLSQLPLSQALAVAGDLRRRADMGVDLWARIVLDLFARDRAQVFNDATAVFNFGHLANLGATVNDPRVQGWTNLFRTLFNYDRRAMISALQRMVSYDVADAAHYAIDAVVATGPSAPALETYIREVGDLGGLSARRRAEAAVMGAMRGVQAYRSATAAEMGLLFVARMYDRGELQDSLVRRALSPETSRRAKHIFSLLRRNRSGQVTLHRVLSYDGPRGRRWLSGISA